MAIDTSPPCATCDQRKACIFQRQACYPLAVHRGNADNVPQHLRQHTRQPSRAVWFATFQ